MNDDLIIENMDLAHKYANDYFKKNKLIDYEDLRQICYLGLVKAARTFDNAKRLDF